MDPKVHKRFLHYRELHAYFGAKGGKPIDAAAFEAADTEQRALEEKGEDARDDEEEARFQELNKLLHRD